MNIKINNTVVCIILLTSSLACGSANVPAAPTPVCSATNPTVKLEAESRPFYMGFTRWPPEATVEGIQHMNEFIEVHGDLTAMHFDGRVPWPEALSDGDYPEAVVNEWQDAKDATPANHVLYIAITPLNTSRTQLTEYWGSSTNQALQHRGISMDWIMQMYRLPI